MNFVLSDSCQYFWPVTVTMPDPEKPGEFMDQTFKMLFEPEGSEAAEERQKAYDAAKTVAEYAAAEKNHLCAICKGWSDIVDDKGISVPFTAETFNTALQRVWFRRGVFTSYRESLSGEKARLGN